MEYCLGDGDGAARIWDGQPDLDLDGDGRLDALSLDFDGDGMRDDALADLDGDGVADHAVLDLDDDGAPESYFTDDGSGTWSIAVDGVARGAPASGGTSGGSGLTERSTAAVHSSISTATDMPMTGYSIKTATEPPTE